MSFVDARTVERNFDAVKIHVLTSQYDLTFNAER